MEDASVVDTVEFIRAKLKAFSDITAKYSHYKPFKSLPRNKSATFSVLIYS